MINLAGNKDCDTVIIKELRRAGIELVNVELGNTEVPFTIVGKFDNFLFKRAWTYWIVEGEVPLDIAKRLYADPIGKPYIRADGHCGRVSPESVCKYFLNGKQLISDPDGKEKEKFEYFINKGIFNKDLINKYQFVIDNTETYDYACVDCYHIDIQDALNLFIQMVRKD